jgi:hypothetical protein
METYEFYATPENGTIVIPEMYRAKITSGVRVILFRQAPQKEKNSNSISGRKSDMLLSPSLKTNGWKFDREFANER